MDGVLERVRVWVELSSWESFRGLDLGVSLAPYSLRVNQIKVTRDFRAKLLKPKGKMRIF